MNILIFCSAITINYKIIEVEEKSVVAILCYCCHQEIQPSKYVDHIKFMAKHRWNKGDLTLDGWIRRQDIQFLKTRVVFSNGLVLYKQNIICTDLGNHSGFIELAKKIYNLLKLKQN